ncbi:DMT family transporter [Rhabdaerophilum calidifontis]|uniref:DMT family transporter n=1 Tax=Rhabdaerophilum calidifontis TaxID=2604328 RepID=UPI00123850CF|nr:DMT family transporter [Rhabdaerophilum calidifontis]
MLDRLPPAATAILAIGVLSAMDVLIKLVGARFPTFQLVFLRFAFGLVAAGALWLWMRTPLPGCAAVRINLVRGLIGLCTASMFFYALQTLPLAETIAFSFLSPLFLAGFGALLLGEALDRRVLAGLVLGFGGMAAMVLGQGFGGQGLPASGVAAAIGSAVTYALSLVLLRQRAQQDALITIVLFQHVVPAIVMAVPAALVWVPPTGAELAIYVALALMGVAGHLLMGMAFRRAEASRLAVTEYSALLYATAFGFLIFDETPGLATLLGTALIVAGTLITIRGRREDARPAEPPIEPAP